MGDIRDLVYLDYDKSIKRLISYGIEFKEFMSSLDKRPNNILVLQGYYGTRFDFTTMREYCLEEDIDEFMEESVYDYGNFAWIDFDDYEGLKSMSKQEVAELYYLGNKWFPVNDTYFDKLNNRFVYCAHDDGWVNHTYYHQEDDLKAVISRVLIGKIKGIYNIDVDEMQEVIDDILALANDGIAIDIMRLSYDDNDRILIPVYKVGHFKDMDAMYDVARCNDINVDIELLYDTKWSISYNP